MKIQTGAFLNFIFSARFWLIFCHFRPVLGQTQCSLTTANACINTEICSFEESCSGTCSFGTCQSVILSNLELIFEIFSSVERPMQIWLQLVITWEELDVNAWIWQHFIHQQPVLDHINVVVFPVSLICKVYGLWKLTVLVNYTMSPVTDGPSVDETSIFC